jgi:hypothetical protein
MDPHSSPHGRQATVALLVLVLSALALALAVACTAPTPASTPPTPPSPPAPAARPAPTAAPPTADAPAPCGQGPCEIRVEGPVTIPLAPGTGVTEIRVVAVDADGVELVAVVPRGQVSTRCSGPCTRLRTSTTDGSGSFRVTAGAGAVVAVNDVTVDVRSTTGGAAVLRLTPG